MRKKLAFVVATPVTYLAFLRGHARALKDTYDITLIANFSDFDDSEGFEDVQTLHVPIARKISPFRDAIALGRLYAHLHTGDFDIVHSVTPKAGLLTNVTGRLTNVPIRVHSFTGQVWATRDGMSRRLLKTLDKLTLSCATHPLADSNSQAEFLASEGFSKRTMVLGDGAICGIDTARFRPNSEYRAEARTEYGIEEDDFVFVFLGRLNRDKGVLDVIEGFALSALGPRFKLLIVGPDEEQLAPIIREHPLARAGQIILTGRTNCPERLLNAGDVMCLPSYREGFGTSVLEGAAIGLPAIVSRIYGLTDAVVEGETGIMHSAGDVGEIASCLMTFAQDPQLCARMGKTARERVLADFSPERITTELRSFYADATDGRPHR